MREIKEFYGENGVPSFDSISKMDYCHGLLKETLRFYSPTPGPLSRLSTVEHTLGNFKILKNVGVRPSPFYNHFHPGHFEDPFEFRPTRWIKENNNFVQGKKALDPYAYLPFSAGARNCIG